MAKHLTDANTEFKMDGHDGSPTGEGLDGAEIRKISSKSTAKSSVMQLPRAKQPINANTEFKMDSTMARRLVKALTAPTSEKHVTEEHGEVLHNETIHAEALDQSVL